MARSPIRLAAPTLGSTAIVAFVAAVVIFGLGGLQIVRTRQAMLADAEKNTGTLARALAQHAGRTIESVDLNLRDAVGQVESGGDPQRLRPYLLSRNPLDQVFNLIIIDPAGRWVADTVASHAPMSSQDRGYFAWHRDHADRGPHVDDLVVGKTSGKVTIPLSRRVNQPDGSFGGLVVGTLNPDFFRSFYQSVQMGPHGQIALWRDDGRMLVQFPELPKDDTPTSLTRANQGSEAPSGVSRIRSRRDGTERIFAFEHVDKYPMIVSVAVSTDDALADWRREALIEAGFVGAAGIMLIALGAGIERRRRQAGVMAEISQEADRRYRLLAENASDLIILKPSFAGSRSYVSPSVQAVLGWTPDELAALPMHQYLHPDDLRRVSAEFASLTSENPKVTSLHRVRHKAGHWVWFEAIFRLTDDREVLISARDVTARHDARQALADSEARYRLLAEHSSDLILLKPTFDGVRTYVSPASRSVVGYDPEEFATIPGSALTHPDDQERVAALFASLNAENPQASSVHRVRHKAGHWIYLEVDFRLTNPGQPDQSVIVRARDVSARHEAEQALVASEARWNFALNSSGQGVWDTDFEVGQTFYSAAWKALLGYADDELATTGSTWLDLMHPADREAAQQADRDHVEGRTDAFDQQFRMRHKDGRWVWIHDRGKVIRRDQNGRPLRMIGINTDITVQKKFEQQLRLAKDRAEAGMAAKAEFVANMSHELRTPLTGILGVHDLLSNDPSLGETQRRLVRIAGEAGRSLLSIVNEVLDFSKIDAGRMEIETIPFDLDALVASCRDLTRQSLKTKPVQIATTSSPDVLGQVMGDPIRIRQVLLNLLTNAVKFTPSGTIAVRTVFRDETGLLRIDVTDSGIGIPADRVGSLFERFTQADTSMTRQYGGTGLGLAICKRLVDLMEGSIGVEASADGGSNFWFELPLARHKGSLAPTGPRSIETRRTAWRLLLAEDNAVIAEIVAAMLQSCGHAVSTVSDGTRALDAARQDPGFDLILMDLQMPVMDGLTATRAIRIHEALTGAPRTPIVGLTANAMVEDVERCLAAGMDAHVAKPVEWSSLLATLDRLLGPAERRPIDGARAANFGDVLEQQRAS